MMILTQALTQFQVLRFRPVLVNSLPKNMTVQ